MCIYTRGRDRSKAEWSDLVCPACLKLIGQVKTNELHPAGARKWDGKWHYRGKLASSRLHATWHGQAQARAELVNWA